MVTFSKTFSKLLTIFLEKINNLFLKQRTHKFCLIQVSFFCIKKDLKDSNKSYNLSFFKKLAGNARKQPGQTEKQIQVMLKVIFILFFKWSNFEKWQTNYQRLSKFPKYCPYMEANTKYVDISKWTSIMSWRNAGPFLEFFNHLLKLISMMRAYVVPP